MTISIRLFTLPSTSPDSSGRAVKSAVNNLIILSWLKKSLAVPAGAKVYFKNLKDGETVKSPVKVEMGVEGMTLDTAGAIVPGTGHHHLLIDAGDSIPAGTVVPKDSTHLHFGKAQSSAEVKLAPGKHVLTLQFADGIHRSYGGKMAATINVNVK